MAYAKQDCHHYHCFFSRLKTPAMPTAVDLQIENCNCVAQSLCDELLTSTNLHYQWQLVIVLLGQCAGILALNNEVSKVSFFFFPFKILVTKM